ncbi:hypothetical protein Tco_0769280 [Tanacetum coccineum]|uniref:Copia protein n=1 Tax=Tanacetum coccineum TaxID=301880 RepID=A0ABQ4Z8Y4_9ASTR
MLPPNNLGPDKSGVSVNETLFRGMIRLLMYLTTSRPDIRFPTCLCARSCFDLKAYLDSDYAGCNLDRKSTSRGCQILGGKLVCWSGKKQSSVTMSLAKAEYVAAAGCCAQVFWIKSQLANYDNLYDKVPIFYDNTSAKAISNNPMLHSRTKHIDIRFLSLMIEKLLGENYITNDLTLLKPCTILAASFKKPLASEVALTSHMLKVAKLLYEPDQSLIFPSEEVNTNDAADC